MLKLEIWNIPLIKKYAVDQIEQPELLPIKAKGKFLVIDVTLKNNGNKTITVNPSFFKLKHGEKAYKADAQVSILAQEDESIFQDVKPGSEVSGQVFFDVSPEIAEASDLQVQIGAVDTQTGIINLK